MNLHDYDWIVCSSSGGKDSQVQTDEIIRLADAQDYPRTKIVVAHADLKRAEWAGTKELAQEQAGHYGLRFEVVSRPQGDLLTQVRARRMWPSSTARYCTSDQKRDQIQKIFVKLGKETLETQNTVKILHCMGLRAEESPNRAKRSPFTFNKRASSKKRHVDEWLPIHHWTVGEIWAQIKKTGIRHHWAYDVGMSRLSCVFCIFAPRAELLLAAEHNTALLNEYVKIEQEIDHTFRNDFKIESIRDALDAGERGKAELDEHGKPCGAWNM